MLLEDPEWSTWSAREIARACVVSHTFVDSVRASLATVASEAAPERTYTTKHGTTTKMRTGRIGKSKPAAAPTPANVGN